MMENKDILQDDRLRKLPFDVPQGYFEGLKDRLGAIPEKGTDLPAPLLAAPSAWVRFRPYLAMAAAFLIMVTAGTALLRKTVGDQVGISEYEHLKYADLIPVTDPYSIFAEAEDSDSSVSDDDIVAYLINTGTSLERIGYETNR